MRTATRVILFSLAFVVGSGLAPVGGESSRAADRSADVLRERIGGCRPLDLSSLAQPLGLRIDPLRDRTKTGSHGVACLVDREVSPHTERLPHFPLCCGIGPLRYERPRSLSRHPDA